MKHSVQILTIVSLLLLGAACQKPAAVTTPPTSNMTTTVTTNTTTNTATVSSINPCSLITQTEAEAVFGKAGLAPTIKGTACRYDTADASKFFDLTVKAGTTADFTTMQGLCGSTTSSVTGLGAQSCATNNTVVVLKGDNLLTLIAGGLFDQAPLRGLAVTAIGRLP